MASVVSDPNGRRRIQWTGANGKRQQIRLGQLDKRTAERIRLRIESLVSAVATRIEPDDETKRWVDGLGDHLHERLASVGLVQPRQHGDLKAFFDEFVAGKSAC